jgi:plastocyanin
MRCGGQKRRVRRPVALVLAGLLGASVVVLPAVASSETTATVEAKDSEAFYKEHHWSPVESQVLQGNSVAFKNSSSSVEHGVEWRPGNPSTPSCSGVPGASLGQPSFAKSWSGTCTFSAPGVYTFWCTVHGSEMHGAVTVSANGTTTVATTTGSTTGATTTAGGSSPSPQSSAGGSALAGSAASAVKLAANQRGGSVRGAIEISKAGEGGRLEVDLMAKPASLASAGHSARVRVGKLTVSHLHAGKNSFSVALNSRARRALRRHGRLAITATMLITAPTGALTTVTRSVLARS